MSIHVSPSLNQDQRIYKAISFFDLVELMTYGELPFNQSAQIRLASLRAPVQERYLGYDTTRRDIAIAQGEAEIQTRAASTTVVYQSWFLAEHEHAIDWACDDASAPSIHIVSTIHALADSLVVSEDMEAFIDRTSRFIDAPYQGHSTRAASVPVFDDSTLTVTLWPRRHALARDHHPMLRLPIDLRTLLTSVLVSPKAPTRFVELVSNLVHRHSHADVSRAHSLA
ncbi:MAG: hypothetical protein EON54_27980 [Alcaligenaceae bacterium]|nr:MAG: hypothetical protein EON54_27980 [Alcaligenaceae bacterium]